MMVWGAIAIIVVVMVLASAAVLIAWMALRGAAPQHRASILRAVAEVLRALQPGRWR